ncbi:MAG: hypothetical protein QXL94_04295 [Candidatus Parvarchaeum sp.]
MDRQEFKKQFKEMLKHSYYVSVYFNQSGCSFIRVDGFVVRNVGGLELVDFFLNKEFSATMKLSDIVKME